MTGRSLLHLQCHFGMDTLSWARLGAQVTGADFSEDEIAVARCLAVELGLTANFVCPTCMTFPRFSRATVQVNQDRVKFQTKDPTDVLVQPITFQPHGSSGAFIPA